MFKCLIKSLNTHQPHCGFSQGSHPYFFDSYTSPIIRAQKTKWCLIALKPLFGTGIFNCLKAPSKVFSFQGTSVWAWKCLGCTSGENQNRAISYKKGRISSRKLHRTRDCKHRAFFLHSPLYTHFISNTSLLRKANPCLLPTLNSPIIVAKTPMTCIFHSEPWWATGCFLCLKGIPRVFPVEEGSHKAWEVLLCNIGVYQHRTWLYTPCNMDISKLQKQGFGIFMFAEDIQLIE